MMLDYIKQNKVRYGIFILLIIIAIAAAKNHSNLSTLCLMVAHFLFLLELEFIYGYVKVNKSHLLRTARIVLFSVGIIYGLVGIGLLIGYLYRHGGLSPYGKIFLGYGIIFVLLIFIPTILKLISKTSHYRAILTLRYLWLLAKTIAVIYASIGGLLVCLSGIRFAEKDFLLESNPFIASYIIIIFFIGECLLIYGGREYLKELPKQTMFYLRKSRTILYLRSFKIDHSELDEENWSEILRFGNDYHYNFIKVGNPNSIFEMDSYYLPTTHWKYHVNKLIRSHKVVYVVLGKTPGLAWEVMEHEEFWPKYIFYVPDKSTLDYWIGLSTSNAHTTLTNILREIQMKDKGVAFYVENNTPYYSESIYNILIAHEKKGVGV